MSNMLNNHFKPAVIIIDDSQSIQRYVSQLLEEAGFRTYVADNGRKGIEYINSIDPDVVLLDIEMPVMSGLNVLDSLDHDSRLYSIILFSHLSAVENRITGLDKGADDYITKPIAPDELIARVRTAARATGLKRELVEARKSSEDALKRFHEAQNRLIEEQKISAVARLASGMAHEINNPLGFIKSNVGTINNYSKKLLECADRFSNILNIMQSDNSGANADVLEYLAWFRKSKIEFIRNDIGPLVSETMGGIERISSIVQYLLVMDRAAFYGSDNVLDVNSLIMAIGDAYATNLHPDVTFETVLDSGAVMVIGKKEQLRIAIENIIDNAVDEVREHGAIKISTAKDDKYIHIDIYDTGDGIKQELMKKVFEPFCTTKKSIEKIGLGLTIAQYIVKAHGGYINLKSSNEVGSCVSLCLPVHDPESVSDNRLKQTVKGNS